MSPHPEIPSAQPRPSRINVMSQRKILDKQSQSTAITQTYSTSVKFHDIPRKPYADVPQCPRMGFIIHWLSYLCDKGRLDSASSRSNLPLFLFICKRLATQSVEPNLF